ncbi:single-stranded DNA-binding protein [Planobispora siamensis]|uniref:Single-stranded DNA-binding protein n=1 Tax=Planobispora siamensis TaxID=936338 RepID=A0A8J3SC62_9ACTN|nr:single-stranded DNA-binding protein [Planobispora siamensis]GIH89901.1 single-stranded DNA-binding protein [Planobispora siamensis]
MSSGDTSITIVGNLTADPDLRFTTSGTAVASFTVAASRRLFDQQSNQWKDGDTLFLRCNAWRQMAEHATNSLAKGMRVIVTGRLRQRDYEAKDGSKRTAYEIDVDELGPSLKFATARVTKTTREQAPHPAVSGSDPWAAAAAPPPGPQSDSSGSGWGGDEPPF